MYIEHLALIDRECKTCAGLGFVEIETSDGVFADIEPCQSCQGTGEDDDE